MSARDGYALEPERGAVRRAHAERLFVEAVLRHLPEEARSELNVIPEEGVPEWARRWHLDCPCVIGWATSHVVMRQTMPDAEAGPMGFGYEPRKMMPSVLDEANDSILDPSGLDLLHLGRARDPHPERSPKALAADPLHESRESFLRRAAAHWSARADLARAHGFVPIEPAPSLRQHCDWLVRYQLGEAFDQIADSDNATVDAVKKALGSLRRILSLPPRRGRGRPRR